MIFRFMIPFNNLSRSIYDVIMISKRNLFDFNVLTIDDWHIYEEQADTSSSPTTPGQHQRNKAKILLQTRCVTIAYVANA